MKVLTQEFLRTAWAAAGESISREIIETGAHAITERLARGHLRKEQVDDFVIDALRSDFERWLRGGESKLAKHYAEAVAEEMERLLLEASDALYEIRDAVAARTGEDLAETQP